MSLEELVPAAGHAEEPFIYTRPDWQGRAYCHPDVIPHVWQPYGDHPTDLFFPEGGSGTKERREAIESICGACPVRAECLGWAIEHEKYGLWANFTPHEREMARQDLGVALSTPEVDSSGRVIGTYLEPAHGTHARYMQHRRDGEQACLVCIEQGSFRSIEQARGS